MKSLIKFLALFSLVAMIGLYSCDKDDDTNGEPLTAEQAKQEISEANDEIIQNFEGMTSASGMKTMMYLMVDLNMMEMEKLFQVTSQAMSPNNLLRFTVNPVGNKFFKPTDNKENSFFTPGIYEYDYIEEAFIKISEHPEDLFTVYFPADQTAYDAQDNNAIADLTTFETETFTFFDEYEGYYDEQIPVAIDFNLKIDDVLVLDFSFAATWIINEYEDGVYPTSLAVSVTDDPYSMSVSWSGSGDNYTAEASIKDNNIILAGADISVILTNQSFEDSPEKISGYLIIAPIKADGYINLYAAEQAAEEDPPNVDLMNENISVDLYQTELNQKLGTLEAKIFMYDDSQEIEPVIVFEDGSWEKLEVLFEDVEAYFEDFFSDIFPDEEPQ
ncbi:MAG: hypothetical protein ACOCWC_00575 [Bacteroidota bacterium]